jgi:hypothetical protein
MSTTVIYNGVEIRNCLTRRFEQECVYDDSGTDKLYDRFIIRVLGYIHKIYASNSPTVGVVLSTNPTSGLAISAASVADNQVVARSRLMEPRKDFRMSLGTSILLQAGPRVTEVMSQSPTPQVSFGDVNNGPKPKQCNIVHIAGTNCLTIEFEIEVCVVECQDASNTSGVLNNRWSMKDSIDGNWYTTRTITGRLRVADINLNPQAFRTLVVPPLQNGFKRESIETTTSPDGLNLDYSISDRELYAACPAPGTTWSGTHTIATGDGSQTTGELNVSMEGPKDADKRVMISLCLDIAVQKLELTSGKTFLQQAHVVDHLDSGKVELRAFAIHNGATASGRVSFLNLPSTDVGKIIELKDYNKDESRVPEVFGTATPTGLFVSYLQSPCLSNHGVPQITVKANEPAQGDKRSENPNINTYSGELPTDQDIASHYLIHQGVYTYYQIECKYHTNRNILQLPIATSIIRQPGAPTTGFITMAPPSTKRTVKIVAQRYGEWPTIPQTRDITVGTQRIIVLDEIVNCKTPQITADGKTRRYEVECEYEYGLARPPAQGEVLQVGKIPWDAQTLADNAMPPEAFDPSLLV